MGPAVLSGKLATHLDLRRGSWGDGGFDLSGSDLVLSALSPSSAHSGVAMVVVPSLKGRAKSLTIASSGVDGRVSIDVPTAELVDLRRLPELLPLPTGLAVDGGRGRARLRADVELGSQSVQGDAKIVARGVRGRAGVTDFFGDLDLEMRARRTGAGLPDTSAPPQKDGAVLLNLGWIDLGYDLKDGATGLVILGPQSWFERKTASMRDTAGAASRKADATEQLARYAAMTPALREDEAHALAGRCTLDMH